MAYNASMYMPQGYQLMQGGYLPSGYPSTTQPNLMAGQSYPQSIIDRPYDARIRVKGIEGAKAFSMPPNSHAILFDEDEDVFFYKSTDAAGYPSIIDFEFSPRKHEDMITIVPQEDRITREEFDALVAKVDGLVAPAAAPKSNARTKKVVNDGE